MNIFYITKLPEVTNPITELQWKIDWWRDQYATAKESTQAAWKMYDDAIEQGEPQDMKDELFGMAEMFEAIEHESWRRWQNAKAEYLAKLN